MSNQKNSTVIKAISIEPELLRKAKMKAELEGFKYSFSRYVCELLERDVCVKPKSPQLVTQIQS